MDDSEREKRETIALGKEIRASITESLYFHGELKETDLGDPAIITRKIKNYFRRLKKNGEDISLVIDYQPSLLEEADRYVSQGNFELAYVFFATYFEHLINGVIEVKCAKEKIAHSTYKELIRKVSLEDKFTWVLEVLKMPDFNNLHWKTIKATSEKRNSFIHYKYQPKPNDLDDEKEWRKVEKNIKAAVKYSKIYQTRISYEGRANKIRPRKK
jgi:hypothetical protein